MNYTHGLAIDESILRTMTNLLRHSSGSCCLLHPDLVASLDASFKLRLCVSGDSDRLSDNA